MARIFIVTCPKCNKNFQADYADFRHTQAELRCPYCSHRFIDTESPFVDDRCKNR
jgi:predicted Zn finger-like uncharacterized protein